MTEKRNENEMKRWGWAKRFDFCGRGGEGGSRGNTTPLYL